jgi:arylsulfatase A-like enzyme
LAVVDFEQVRDLNYTEGTFQTMVRSHDWKLVHFLDESRGQLFNLRDDPDEFENLWDSPEHQTNYFWHSKVFSTIN